MMLPLPDNNALGKKQRFYFGWYQMISKDLKHLPLAIIL
jgi:hypothetical protein